MAKERDTTVISLENLSKSMGSRVLFDDVSISFVPGNRYGVTGPNGAGKSTLLKIMMGVETASKGSVVRPKRTSFLKQNIHELKDVSVIDVVIRGNNRLWQALHERDHLYEQEITNEIGLRLGELEEIVVEEDGYSADSDAEILLSGIGVPEKFHRSPLGDIPLDLQFRAMLCQALFGQPDALLLDEPTNHLDMESIGWLEGFLQGYKGTLLVVSHDRHFLNAVTTHIADIDYETVIIYPGNYDNMIIAKSSVRDRAEQNAKSKEKKIAQLREFVSRFGAGTRASQVQSRLREIDKLQPQELKKSNIQRPYIRFIPSEKQAGKVVLSVEDLVKAYIPGVPVIENFSLEIHRGDKIGIIGNNGRGKTTLLKLLAKVLVPDQGKIIEGHNCILSYFPQNHEEAVNKQDASELFSWLKERRPGVYDQEVRSALGKMLFGGDDAFKLVNNLSGGETARLILASMILAEHNLLLLDEPNNHLDLEAVSALGWALEEYKGTAIVASHDRDLLDRFAKKIIAFTDHGIEVFDGPLEEYISTQRQLATK